MRRIAAIVLVVAMMLSPSRAFAQRGTLPPLDVAESVADCMTGRMPDAITRPAWVEHGPVGYRVVIALRGQPGANRDVQSPPPAADALAWLDLARYDDPAVPSGEVNGISEWIADGGSATYVPRMDGYVWLRVIGDGRYCLDGALGVL